MHLQGLGEANQLPVGDAPDLGLHLGQRLEASILRNSVIYLFKPPQLPEPVGLVGFDQMGLLGPGSG